MVRARKFRLLCYAVAGALLCALASCAVYLRSATTVVQNLVSPDGTRDAIVVVVNGGGMTWYVTAVSIVGTRSKLGREFLVVRGRRDFLVDDNDGAVRWGSKGEITLVLRWASDTELVITYPRKARV